MKVIIQVAACALGLLMAAGCNITSGSRVVVGNARPAVEPETVKLYLRPPAKFEEIAILNATSRNAFASDQSLTDSVLLQMKKDAAKLGANGILLGGIGTQQIGSVGQSFGNAFASSSGSATAYGLGNMVQAFGSGTTSAYGTGTAVSSGIFQKASAGMAIYVIRE